MRFILDIANKTESKPEMEKIIDFLSDEIATIHCIDKSNSSQFYEETEKNILTKKQIRNYNNQMKNTKETNHSNFKMDDLKPTRKEQIAIWLISPVLVLGTWSLLIWICSQ